MEGGGGGGLAELEDRGGEDSRLLSVGLSAVCPHCFNREGVSVGRLNFLVSRREKETPAAPPVLVSSGLTGPTRSRTNTAVLMLPVHF